MGTQLRRHAAALCSTPCTPLQHSTAVLPLGICHHSRLLRPDSSGLGSTTIRHRGQHHRSRHRQMPGGQCQYHSACRLCRYFCSGCCFSTRVSLLVRLCDQSHQELCCTDHHGRHPGVHL